MERIIFETMEEKTEELQELQEELGLESNLDLINNSLAILNWAKEEKTETRSVPSMKKKGYTESFQYPFSITCRPNHKQSTTNTMSEPVKWTFENRSGEVAAVDGEIFFTPSKTKAEELAVALGCSRLIGIDSDGNISEVKDLD